jgi:hypothetical protein
MQGVLHARFSLSGYISRTEQACTQNCHLIMQIAKLDLRQFLLLFCVHTKSIAATLLLSGFIIKAFA